MLKEERDGRLVEEGWFSLLIPEFNPYLALQSVLGEWMDERMQWQSEISVGWGDGDV